MTLSPMTDGICARLAGWHERYPYPSEPPEMNAAARRSEDAWLAGFAGLDALDRSQATELVRWKFQSMPHRRALAMRGISPDRWDTQDGRTGAGDLISQALASADDLTALQTMASAKGIYRFGPAMSSVVLAACRPGTFTIADTRALKTLRALGLLPDGPEQFRVSDWQSYLSACRHLSSQCGLRLREVDRALWVAASDPGLQR